uniref:Glutaminyl-tRNA synthetase class Ib non-specific RNA-binding domain-containing protein n=1 Tax=Nothoprocta perdicaria TaxID=30464 RepID=A0A8C7EAH5_NOTPE
MAAAEALGLFTGIGLSEAKARETLRNAALSALLRQAVLQAQRAQGPALDKATGTLLYSAASRLKAPQHLGFLRLPEEPPAGAAGRGRLRAGVRRGREPGGGAAGRARPRSPPVRPQVEAVVSRHRAELLAERYRFNMGLLMGERCGTRYRYCRVPALRAPPLPPRLPLPHLTTM